MSKEALARGTRNAQKIFRDRSVQQSGNPNAWSDLMQWVKFHHPTIVNAALACYIRKKQTVPDVTSRYLLRLSLHYRNDPSLPVELQFTVAGTHFTSRDGPFASQVYEYIFEQRLAATELGWLEMGERLYWGTGAYLLVVRFRPGTHNVCSDGVPFWKHFSIDKMHADARPACRDPHRTTGAEHHGGQEDEDDLLREASTSIVSGLAGEA